MLDRTGVLNAYLLDRSAIKPVNDLTNCGEVSAFRHCEKALGNSAKSSAIILDDSPMDCFGK